MLIESAPLKESVAIVTGASRGIGRAIGAELGRRGAAVVLNYHQDAESAEAAAVEIRAEGGVAETFQADVSDEHAVRKLIASAIKRFGRLDVLVCCAGVIRDGLAAAVAPEDWRYVIDTNLTGCFLCIREALPHMLRQKRGSIVTVSSVNASAGGQGQVNYAASKAGVEALTRSLAIEVAPKGIRVNAVAPGLIATAMTAPIRARLGNELLSRIPMKRYGTPEDVARAVAFLASPESCYITGAVLPVAGGLGL
jgi:3-oxoacyl-[acyl-carrier protein] reductase